MIFSNIDNVCHEIPPYTINSGIFFSKIVSTYAHNQFKHKKFLYCTI